MTLYIVRIELHGAKDLDYPKLHAAMLLAKFQMQIPSGDGRLFKLPTAEYVIASEKTLDEVNEDATRAASSIGRDFDVLTVEAKDFRYAKNKFETLEVARISNIRPA